MRTWNELRVATRLHIAFGALFLLIATLLGVGYWKQRQSDETLRTVVVTEFVRANQVAEWQLASSVAAQKIIALNRTGDPALAELFGKHLDEEIKAIDVQQASIRTWATSEAQGRLFERILALDQRLEATTKKIDAARATGDTTEAVREFENGFLPAVSAYNATIAEFRKLHQDQLQASTEAVRAHDRRVAILTMMAFLIVASGTGFVVNHLVRYVVRSLNRAVNIAEAVAAGDLVHQSTESGGDEFGGLMSSLGRMSASLRALVMRVQGAAAEMASASRELASSNGDLSVRTERQAAALQQTSSTMEELAAAVQHTASNAREADKFSVQTSAIAEKGGAAVGRLVQTMRTIDASSRRVEEIIAVIDGISFQTRLLALNASVEAARAGRQGDGFAVVAGEVRNLAQRSAEAAHEIKKLIASTGEGVRNGSIEAEAAGRTITDVVKSVQQVAKLIAGISSSTTEQSSGLAGISATIACLDNATQQDSAMVEQAAAAASSLQDQAGVLTASVAAFKLQGQTH